MIGTQGLVFESELDRFDRPVQLLAR